MAGKNAGEWAYVVSLVIAVLAGLAAAAGFGSNAWVALLLVILGVIVGFLNVSEKETGSFLVASIALLVASLGASPDGTTGVFSPLGLAVPRLDVLLNSILGHLAVFVAPAAIIIAIKAVNNLASKR